MANVRGGLHFVRGSLVQVPEFPKALSTQPLLLDAPGQPEVLLGQQVQAGDVLARSQTLGKAHCVSPIQGTIQEFYESGGGNYLIAVEPTQSSAPTSLAVLPPQDRQLETWLPAMQLAGHWSNKDGYVGLLAQLAAAIENRPDTVICLAIDPFPPYPYLSSLMASFAQEMVQGTQLIGQLVQAQCAMLATSTCKYARRSVNPYVKKSDVKMVSIEDHYPIGNISLAVSCLQPGRRVAYQTNPIEQGVMVISPWSAIRLGRWIKNKKLDLVSPLFMGWPEAEIPMTATYAWPGQSIASLHTRLDAAVGKKIMKLIMGDPMTGHSLAGHANPVVSVDDLLLTLCDFQQMPSPSPCIACGKCLEVCPTRLNPIGLYEQCLKHEKLKNKEQLKSDLASCIQCGLCSHLCPSALPLAETFEQVSARYVDTL